MRGRLALRGTCLHDSNQFNEMHLSDLDCRFEMYIASMHIVGSVLWVSLFFMFLQVGRQGERVALLQACSC